MREHPKTYSLAEALCVDKVKAVGHLHFLWWWCVDYAPKGVLKGFSDTQIARAAEWGGDPKAFVEALVGAKFIDRVGGVLTVHDWMDFCGSLIKKRLERVGARREPFGSRTGENGVLPTVPTNRTNPTIPNQPSNGAFAPPTLDQVKAYCKERKNGVDPHKWHDFYTAKGWMVGKNKMRDWRAAVRTWEPGSRPRVEYPEHRPLTKDELEAGYEALDSLPKPDWLKK